MAETVGQKLLQARTHRGISLEEAARATRIRCHYLQALEADDLASLPSPAQYRGFLRLYADYLGVNQTELNGFVDQPKATVKTTTLKAKSKRPQDVVKTVEATPQTQAPPSPDPVILDKTSVDNVAPTGPSDPSHTHDQPDQKTHDSPGTIEIAQGAMAKPPPAKKPFIKLPFKKAPNLLRIEKPPKTPNRVSSQEEEEEEETPRTSQEMILEIGHTLRKQREMLNLSLEEVERFTRLRLHHLKTLENGRMEDLASPVQARGMLSNYSRFLNLDDEKILLAFADALLVRRLERLHTSPGQKSEAKTVTGPGLRRFLSLDLVLGSLIIIGMFAFLIWGLTQVVDSQKQAAAQATLPSVAQVLAISPTDTPGTPSPSGPAPTKTTDFSGGQTGLPTDVSSTGSPPTLTTQPEKQTNSTGQTPVPGGPPLPSGPIQVYVVARNSAWMRVLVDGKEAFVGRVIPGNAYTYAANKQLEVISGNAAALQILYNQNDLGSLGVVNQVIDLIFTSNGLVAPTATITPTPTKKVTGTTTLTGAAGPALTGTPLVKGTLVATSPAKATPYPTSRPGLTATATY